MQRFLHHIQRSLREIKRERAQQQQAQQQQQQQQLPPPPPQPQQQQPPTPPHQPNAPVGEIVPLQQQQDVTEVCILIFNVFRHCSFCRNNFLGQ